MIYPLFFYPFTLCLRGPGAKPLVDLRSLPSGFLHLPPSIPGIPTARPPCARKSVFRPFPCSPEGVSAGFPPARGCLTSCGWKEPYPGRCTFRPAGTPPRNGLCSLFGCQRAVFQKLRSQVGAFVFLGLSCPQRTGSSRCRTKKTREPTTRLSGG